MKKENLKYRVRAVGEAHGAAGGGGGIGGAGRRVDVVLVDVAELLIHGVVVEWFALVVGVHAALEVARAHQLPVGLVGDHGVAPPVVHRPQVVVVVVRHRVSHLQIIIIIIIFNFILIVLKLINITTFII